VVSGSLDLTEVLNEALAKTIEVTRMDCGAAYRLDEQSQSLILMAHRGLSDEFAAFIASVPRTLALGDKPLIGESPVTWSPGDMAAGEWKRHVLREGLVLAVGGPLLAKGRLVGAIMMGSRTACTFSADETALLAAIGQQVGLAVENTRLYGHAEEAAVFAERQRLARELHDAVTQTLFSASLIADVLPRLWDRNQDEARRRLAELRELTRGALAEMRTLLHELRPSSLTEMALGDLLRQLGEATNGRARIPVTVQVESQCPLSPNIQVALYRIAQEALNNVAKHSSATAVSVTLRCAVSSEVSKRVQLSVEDNGCGFDRAAVSPTSLGLGIMSERAAGIGAELTISSVVGQGTRVVVVWSEPKTRTGV
jgi:signal transduction histidine kinase